MSDYFEEQDKAVDAQEVTTTKIPQDEDGSNKSSSEQSTNENGDSLEKVEDKPEGTGDKPENTQEQKLYTKEEFDASAAKIKAIYEKKGRRAVERELVERFANQSQPPTIQVQSQAPNVPPAPDNNSFWDPSLNQWLPNDITVPQYVELANQVLSGQQAQYIQPTAQPVSQAQIQQNHNSQSTKSQFSENAENQAIECEVNFKDFSKVMKGAPITPTMANAASVDPKGMQNLYEMMKESPHELYQISQLSNPIEQQNRMWLMNQKFAQKRLKKVQTKATEQPTPLEANGKINKPWSELSYLEKKRARENEIWG